MEKSPIISSNSSNENERSGNNIQISPAVKWLFTHNNYTLESLKDIKEKLSSNSSKYYIFGFEVGESGTPHLQGYVEFSKKIRPMSFFAYSCHWTKAKGSRLQNFNYCSKGGHYIINGVEVKPIKIIDKLYPWQEKIYKIISKEPDDRTIYWIYEKKGNRGKSALLKYIVVKHLEETLVVSGKGADIKNGIVDFFEKKGHYPRNILINCPRSFNCDYLSLPTIEEIKDGLFYSGKYHGGMCVFNPPHIIIMANVPLNSITDDISENRWKQYEITNDGHLSSKILLNYKEQ